MDALRIVGGAALRGVVDVSGAKNASLPAMAAALLADGTSTLRGAPDLADIRTLATLLGHLGVRTTRHGNDLAMDGSGLTGTEAPYELVRTMRATILVLGPLLARCGEAKVSLPGGCAIGARPVDQHLVGLRALGAEIGISHGYVIARAAKGLVGADVTFDMQTVTGTENIMLAAALAKGTTRLHNAACEPEVVDLAELLAKMGVPVHGAGTDCITIEGQKTVSPYDHHVVADRIECGTLLIAGALAGYPLTVRGGNIAHQESLLHKLRTMGCSIAVDAPQKSITIAKPQVVGPVEVQTAPYPGFPTDMQAQLMVPMALASGTSVFTETIFENRFMHVDELNRMGANIRVDGRTAVVHGVKALSGTTVMATDLRASACLVLAGLVAEGETTVRRVYHLDRGYEGLEKKLAKVGATIRRFVEI
ncbi:udp-n-acetylglucosamine 1-carboxyvinyltransferase [Ceraceosorus bombacis]|uniref:UDP-N-acetylglucosamine 1-carboxyvinyltransferase n=1 Tax=Ceraceosorus bombacis TaxID=401625 RepID=A0A0P1BM71_9BASI|nr:udp-n-acetylglucosamine 1-carboxyvinyltransferase [Ceraceosorus bombacis]